MTEDLMGFCWCRHPKEAHKVTSDFMLSCERCECEKGPVA